MDRIREIKRRRLLTTFFISAIPLFFTAQNNAVVLNGGYVILNGGTAATNIYVVVNQNNTAGIVRQAGGHISSEGQWNFVKWNAGTGTGNYIFPFGVGGTAADYIPFTFNKTTAANSDIGMSTWTTDALNMPHPAATNVPLVSNMTGVPDSVNNAIDRFWDIQSPSVTGDLTFSYRGIENTTLVPTDTFKAQHWSGAVWDPQAGPGNPGVTTGIGTVGPIPGQTTFSPWVLTRIALTATVTSAQNAVCAGQCNGTATVTPMYGVAAYFYQWSDGQTTSVATGLCAGVYTCVVTDAVLATTTVTVNISSNPLPVITANSPVMCAGNTSTLTANGASSYTWSPATGLSSTTGATVTATPATTTSYTLTGVDGNGCQDTTQVTVTINPLPIVTAASATICSGQSTVLTAGGANTYTWSTNAGSATTNTVSVTPPTGVTVYTVTGESASNCIDSTTVSVTVNTLPVVTASATSPSLCVGQSMVLTAGGATSYTWSANAGSATTNTVSVSPTVNTTYTVTGDLSGCVNTETVTVSIAPNPTITTSASTDTVCSGQSVVLTANGALSYTWMPGSVTSNTVSVSPGTSTTYTVTGDSLGCMATQTIAVNITPTPTISINSSGTSICSGQSTVLTGSGATNYTWMPGGISTNTISVSPSASISYTLTGETGGCMDSSVVNIVVTPNPTITATASSATICAGQGTILTGGGATSYTWNPGGIQTSTVNVNPSATTIYTLTGANGNCVSTETIAVNVNALPNVTASASSTTTCTGQGPIILTGSGATSYTWSANTGSATTSTVSVNPGTTEIYTVTGTLNGCDNTAQVTVSVNPTPTITLSSSAPSVCAGQGAILNGAGATNYTWMPGGANTSTLSVSPGASTTYTITGETGGCLSSQTVAVTVNPNPSIIGTSLIDTAKCGANTGGVSGLSASGGTPNYTYQWVDAGGNIVGTADTLTGVGAGTYSLIVTDANLCSDTSNTGFTIPATGTVSAAITPPLSQGTATLDVTFTNNSVGATLYNWSFGNGITSTQQTPGTISYDIPGTYTVVMIAGNGTCSDTAYALVIVDIPTLIIIPNIFSPNGDGINDEFFIVTSGMRTLNCDIFNRWGQLVYTLLGPNHKWDGIMNNGNRASEGTYYYILTATGFDGKTYDAKGPLTLVK